MDMLYTMFANPVSLHDKRRIKNKYIGTCREYFPVSLPSFLPFLFYFIFILIFLFLGGGRKCFGHSFECLCRPECVFWKIRTQTATWKSEALELPTLFFRKPPSFIIYQLSLHSWIILVSFTYVRIKKMDACLSTKNFDVKYFDF